MTQRDDSDGELQSLASGHLAFMRALRSDLDRSARVALLVGGNAALSNRFVALVHSGTTGSREMLRALLALADESEINGIGAGILEDWVRQGLDENADWIVREVRANARFARALAAVTIAESDGSPENVAAVCSLVGAVIPRGRS